MADALIKMKTGTIAKLEEKNGNTPVVPLDTGTVYFAVDTNDHIGKIVYDAPNGNSTDRIVMSTQAEYADTANIANSVRGMTGIYSIIGSQTSNTASWTGGSSYISELYDGLTIAYYLPRTSANNVTLNLTLSTGLQTGAIPVYFTGTTRMGIQYTAGSTIILTYWSAGSISVGGSATGEARWTHSDYDTTNIYQLRHNNGTYVAKSAIYRYQLLVQEVGSTKLLPFNNVNNSTATNKTLTIETFDPFGQILYYDSTTTVAANGNIGASTLFSQKTLNLGYSFNTGTTLTTGKDVYIVALPYQDGARLSPIPISQDLPTSADGLIYIYLGRAYSTSAIELYPYHPVYCYKNNLQLYTGEGNATTSISGLMSSSDKTKLDGIQSGATNVSLSATSPISVSAATGAVSITHDTSGPSSSDDTTKGETGNKTPAFGETFTVTSGTVDKFGHTTAFADHTVKIPDAIATADDPGLMSASMVTKLAGIETGAQVNTITGVKGNNETAYRTGNVNITKANIGLGNVDNKSSAIIRSEITSANISSALGYTPASTSVVTSSANGLMSAADKTNFDSGLNIAGNTLKLGGTLSAATLRTSLGLSNAMHFIGIATVIISDGQSIDPKISGYTFANAQPGDVVIDSGSAYEYVWTGSAWERLGPDGSYALADHTHPDATTENPGFMTTAQVTKLNGIQAGATAVSFSRSLTSGTKIGTITINGTATDLYSTNNTWTAFKGATASAAGTAGYINAAPAAGNTGSYFGSDGAWHGNATTSAAGLMSSADKTKLDGIASGAKAGTVTSVATGVGLTGGTITGSGTIKAYLRSETKLTNDSAAATETAGRVYPVVPDKTGYLAVNVPWVNTTYSNVTTSAAGLMSSADKTKLDGITNGAQPNVIESVKINNTALTISSKAVNIPLMGGASASAAGSVGVVPAPAKGDQAKFLRADGTWVVPTNTTYSNATTEKAGLMSATDKGKLDGITVYSVSGTAPVSVSVTSGAATVSHATSGPSTTADTSKGDTSNQTPTWGGTFKVTSGTVDKFGHTKTFAEHTVTIPNATATTSAAGLMSTSDKTKLDGIAAGAKAGTVTLIAAGTGLNTSADQADSATKGSITTSGTLYLTTSGVTAGTYGPASATTSATGSSTTSVNIPYITVDKYGRITSISNRTFSSSDNNTDTKVSQVLTTTDSNYPVIFGNSTTSSTTATLTEAARRNNSVYINPSTGLFAATKVKVAEAVTLEYNTTTKSLDFIFG